MADEVLWPETIDPSVKRDVEACLFASGTPLTAEALLAAVGQDDCTSLGGIESVLHSLVQDFPPAGARGFELVSLAGVCACRTNPHCQQAVSALFELPDDASKLSPAAMEVLAIVAYLQPVSRPQITEVRGVNSDSPMQRLLDRELITEVGRSQAAGGAVLYGTTARFQVVFGLSSLEDLPDLEGFALGEEQKENLRRRLGLLAAPE